MRAWFVAVALVAACKSGTQDAKQQAKPASAPAAMTTAQGMSTVPVVTVATVLAKDEAKPPLLVLVDATGKARLAAAASWADLDAGAMKIAKTPVAVRTAARYVKEQFDLEKPPTPALAAWDALTAGPDFVDLEEHLPRNAEALDAPPPPEPEDDDDKGETEAPHKPLTDEESIRLDDELTRRGNVERAKWRRLEQIPGAPYAYGDRPAPNEDGTPSRVAQIGGAIYESSALEQLRAMIFIAPTAMATTLIEVLRDSQGAIAVAYNGKVRPLRVQFTLHTADEPKAWLEARVTMKGLAIEAVPDVPLEVASLDAAQVAAALDKARTAHGLDAGTPVDVLVDPDVTTQRLVDVLVALDIAGVRSLGLGAAPTGEQLARRGHRRVPGPPGTTLGALVSQGAVDKAVISDVVKAQLPRVHACYTTALAGQPTLAGTVETQFFIKPDGKVAVVSAGGIDPTLTRCVADVVRTLEFPASKNEGTMVNCPFAFRP